MDELDKRRNQDKEAKASEMDAAHKDMAKDAFDDFMHATSAQRNIAAFGVWVEENMPVEMFQKGAPAMASSTLGAIIGSWLGAGASPELVKEFLAKFTDVVWEQFKEG